LQLFILPDIPLLDLGDQTIFLVGGTKLLEGQVIYRDFFQFVFPGTEVVYFALFKLWGVRAWIPGAALVLVGVGLTWLSIMVSKRLVSGPAAFLPGLLFLTLPFRTSLFGTHHWYSTLAVMAGLAVLVEERSPRRLMVAGALCGLSAWFNQSRGLMGVLGLAVFLLWERNQEKLSWRLLLEQEVRLIGSFFCTVVGLSGYFLWVAGLKRFLYCTIVFGTKYYPSESFNKWTVYGADLPSFDNWYKTTLVGTRLAIYLLVPLVYILFLFRAWRERARRPQEPWDRLMLVSIVGLFLFIGVAPAASYVRLCTVALPAFILLVWFVKWPGRLERVALRLMWVAVLGLMVMETRSIQTRLYETMDLPVGRIASFHPGSFENLRWFLAHAGPSDFLFGDTALNFALGLRNPAQVNWLTSTDYTRPEQVQNVVETLEKKRVRWVAWDRGLDDPGGLDDHLQPLRSYLRTHYHLAKSFYDGEEQILERNQP
jgi:hypothetical protein